MTGQMLNAKLRNYASIVEPDTLQQAYQTAALSIVYPYVALMPDAHRGIGCTVGSVVPTLGGVAPAIVGVDIGCGMVAWLTTLTADDLGGRRALTDLRLAIEAEVPLSAGRYNSTVRDAALANVRKLEADDGAETAERLAPNWRLQMGSLGSGNHFIELSLDEQDRVWIFLHSGSRGVGNKIAQHHIKIAQQVCKEQLPNRDLAWLREGSDEFVNYVADLRWAQRFALLNRDTMVRRVFDALREWYDGPIQILRTVACHHNYTEQREIAGEQVWLSRKGAIDASEGKAGLIPGSMGAASYVVRGLGNADGLFSAPHGAGRNYSRSKAKKLFDMADLEQRMAGIEWRHTDAFLDEHPLAYKDIDQVMEDAAELVAVEHTLHQILNVKGD